MNRIALTLLCAVLAAHKANKNRPVAVVASPLGGWLVDVPKRFRSIHPEAHEALISWGDQRLSQVHAGTRLLAQENPPQ